MDIENHQEDSKKEIDSSNDSKNDRDASIAADQLKNTISSNLVKFRRLFPSTDQNSNSGDSPPSNKNSLDEKNSVASSPASSEGHMEIDCDDTRDSPAPTLPETTPIAEPPETQESNSSDKQAVDEDNALRQMDETEQNEIHQDTNSKESNGNEELEVSEKSDEKESSKTQKTSTSSPKNPAQETDEDGQLKIQMVTTIDTDVFVEPPTGPMSPDNSSRNPLESEESQPPTATDKEKTNELPVSNNTEESSNSKDSASKDDGPSDVDAAEVITCDNSVASNLNKVPEGTASPGNEESTPESNNVEKVKEVSPTANQQSSLKKGLRVLYPKKNVTDMVKVTKAAPPQLKNCLQCSKLTNCDIVIEISGNECFLCSEECLKLHKVDQVKAIQQLKKSSQLPDSDKQEGMDSRVCVNCDSNVSGQSDDKILSWEAMEFCNEDCLAKYQTKMWSFCTGCKKDVQAISMGKYSVRFGHEVKQFCSVGCLEEFKKGIKVCSFCQKDLTEDDGGFLAPIGEKGQFKDFCSQVCLDEYFCMSQNMPSGGLKVDNCGVCDKKTFIQVQVITGPDKTVNLCSVVCLKAFKFVNSAVSPAPCYMCKKYFDKTLPNCTTIYYENELLSFCSKTCMNINILTKRKIVACSWCKVKKYNFDMIRRKSRGIVSNWCSVNCITLYQVSANVVSGNKSSKPCTHCGKIDIPSIHLTMSDATIRNFCSLDCVNKYQASFPSTAQANGSTESLPVIQSVSALKKTPEIKVISSASMNGLQQSSPGSQAGGSVGASAQGSPQQVMHQILVIPKAPPEMVNVQVQTKPATVSKSVTVRVNRNVKTSQTDPVEENRPIIIPVPVPIYVPCPMAMYSLPAPIPLPIPIPVAVPIIIPTTKGSADEILAEIQRIREKMPGNPYEAEVLMMAELASQRGASSEELSVEEDIRGKGVKRALQESLDEGAPPDKKHKEHFDDDPLTSTAIHLTVSQQPMSLKETLGVSAWKNFAAMNGEDSDLLKMKTEELALALKKFIKNAKIPDGGSYTPDQKYFLMLGIQCYLTDHNRSSNIFYDKGMEPFIEALDEEAVSFQKMFGPNDYVITRVEEEHLWDSKQLGPHSPSTVLATLIYFNTKYFNLITAEEHMRLTFKDVVKQWKQMPSSANASTYGNSNISLQSHLRYTPPESELGESTDFVESNPKKKPYYEQFSNKKDPYKCPIQLYEFYLSKCPKVAKVSGESFYLSPENSCIPDSPIWYSTLPLPKEVISRTLNRFKMAKEINLAILASL